jgi:hypothetical protein
MIPGSGARISGGSAVFEVDEEAPARCLGRYSTVISFDGIRAVESTGTVYSRSSIKKVRELPILRLRNTVKVSPFTVTVYALIESSGRSPQAFRMNAREREFQCL